MPHRPSEQGYTLVEVVIATLIIAMMAGPMMSVALTGRMSVGRTDRRVAAAASVRRLSETLKAFVTADRTLALGPGSGADGWTLPGDDSGAYALAAGHHALQVSQWAPALAAYQGAIAYDVAVRSTPSGPQPDVTFSIAWSEP